MLEIEVLAVIERAKAKVENAIDYSARDGAVCPECGERLAIVTSRPWEGDCKIRYHKCHNFRCILGCMEISIKSLQEA